MELMYSRLVGSTTFELRVLPYRPAAAGAPQHLSFPICCLVQSPVFAAGGYYWCFRMHPLNFLRLDTDRFSASLQLMSRGATTTSSVIRASHELSVIDTEAVLPPRSLLETPPRKYFVSGGGDCGGGSCSAAAASGDLYGASLHSNCIDYVRLGRLVFQFTATILPEDDHRATRILVPRSDMLDQLGEALETGEGADVTFSVEGELFPAHRVVLAARSPVFRAELYGEMRENGAAAQAIVIDEMRTATFRALLRYIYTDASPAAIITSTGDNQDEGDDDDDGSEDDVIGVVSELLTAADRYDVRRLKLICERVLCRRLDVENVADTLALADRHHCDTLKDDCIEFMTTSQRMGQVAATQGYMQLKSCHPHLIFEVLEKSSNFQWHVE
ncbi:unnamed protein product [Urochloa humidicola]